MFSSLYRLSEKSFSARFLSQRKSMGGELKCDCFERDSDSEISMQEDHNTRHSSIGMNIKEIQVTCMNLVLVGRAGNGKSSTGNSILHRGAFKCKTSLSVVTRTTQVQQALVDDCKLLRVIDTPGLFDLKMSPDLVKEEIAKSVDLARDGIHGVLLVVSLKNRFTVEEVEALNTLKDIFGEKIMDYVVFVFTHGDVLDDTEEDEKDAHRKDLGCNLREVTIRDFSLQEVTIRDFSDRFVIFNNRSENPTEKAEQVHELFDLIEYCMAKNEDQPFTSEQFRKAQVKGDRTKVILKCKGYEGHALSVENGRVMMKAYNVGDATQIWIKDERWAEMVKHRYGRSAFCLVNERTQMALRTSFGSTGEFLLTKYSADVVDQGTLWTEGDQALGLGNRMTNAMAAWSAGSFGRVSRLIFRIYLVLVIILLFSVLVGI